MIELFKLFWRDIGSQDGRYTYFNFFIDNVPGCFGNRLRGRLAGRYLQYRNSTLSIHKNVTVQHIERMVAGENVQIGQGCFIQASGGVTFGDDVMLGPSVKIWSVNHNFDDLETPIYKQGYQHEPVDIGKGVWLGANVFVMPGVSLPEGCVVSAGSVVSKKKYKPYSLLAGNPCRMIGSRLQSSPARN